MTENYPSEIPDFYIRLGVRRGADYDEIKKAYRKAALYWHPDKNPSRKERAHIEFIALSEAFERLSCQADKNKEYFAHAPKEERGTYEYYYDLFNKIFEDEEILKFASPALKTIVALFKQFKYNI